MEVGALLHAGKAGGLGLILCGAGEVADLDAAARCRHLRAAAQPALQHTQESQTHLAAETGIIWIALNIDIHIMNINMLCK